MIALTKRDLVDAAGLERARAEVTERVRGTALEGAPIVACSSATGEGFGELGAALDAMLAGAPEPEREGRPRLHVDRVFSIKGSGTVVTGTLTGGPLTTGAEVELLPSGTRARVRGLQTHHRDVAERDAGLEGRGQPHRRARAHRAGRGACPGRPVDRHVRPRGAHRARPIARPSDHVARRVQAARGRGRARRADPPRTTCKQVPADGAFVRITLSEPLVLDVGDRFVLRESGRRRTIAGGVVLDTAPPRRAGPTPTPRLEARAHASRAELPALLVAERRAVRVDDVRSILGLAPEDVDGAIRLGGWWVARGAFDEVGAAVTARLAAFHAEEPAAAGEDVATVRRSVAEAFAAAGAPRDLELADAAIARLETEGALVREGAAVRLASHRAEAGDEIAALVEIVRSGEPTPPTIAELRASGVAAGVLDAAVRSGALVRISPELVLTRELVERAGTVVREAGADGITVSALRERLGTSRKYAVPLAEHLDRTGVTRRSGDLRFARGAATGSGGSPAQPS